MKHLLFTLFMALVMLPASAQDDMYFTPSKQQKATAKAAYDRAHETYYIGSDRDVDEYNRRGRVGAGMTAVVTDSGLVFREAPVAGDSVAGDVISFSRGDGKYEEASAQPSYQATRNLSRFDGAQPEVNIYVGSPWYDPWYDPWFDPWPYRASLYWRTGWYGPSWAWHTGWYDPYWHGGWHSGPYWHGGGWIAPRHTTVSYRGGTAGGYRGVQRGTGYYPQQRNNYNSSGSARSSYSGVQRGGGSSFGGGSSYGGGGVSRGGGGGRASFGGRR